MDFPNRRLALGIAATAAVIGLCFVAVWSVRGRLAAPAVATHVQETAISPAAASDIAKIAVLQAQVARLKAERDAALAQVRALEGAAAPPVAGAPPPPAQAHPAAPAPTGGFGEPQTFGTLSTSQ